MWVMRVGEGEGEGGGEDEGGGGGTLRHLGSLIHPLGWGVNSVLAWTDMLRSKYMLVGWVGGSEGLSVCGCCMIRACACASYIRCLTGPGTGQGLLTQPVRLRLRVLVRLRVCSWRPGGAPTGRSTRAALILAAQRDMTI